MASTSACASAPPASAAIKFRRPRKSRKSDWSNLRIKIKEGIERRQKLSLDAFFAFAFNKVHRYRGGFAVFQVNCSVFEAFQLVRRQKPDPVNHRQLCHQINISSSCVMWSMLGRRPWA